MAELLGRIMIPWIDAYLFPLLVGLPTLGIFFVSIMPSTDRISLRHTGMGAALGATAISLYAAARLTTETRLTFSAGPSWVGGAPMWGLDGADVPALLTLAVIVPMSLRAGAPRIVERMKFYIGLTLTFQVLATLTILAKSPLLAFITLDATSIPLLLLLASFGGPVRGSAVLRVGVTWFVVDMVSIGCIVWLTTVSGRDVWVWAADLRGATGSVSANAAGLTLLALGLSAYVRLANLPLSAWLTDFLEEAPISAAALVIGGVAPIGSLVLFRHALTLYPQGLDALHPGLSVVLVAGVVLPGVAAAFERDLRRFTAYAALLFGAFTTMALFSMDVQASAGALMFCPLMGAGLALLLFVTDALERRYLVRDSADLIGVAEQLPAMWRLMVVALLTVCVLPLVVSAPVFLPMLSGIVRGQAHIDASLPRNLAVVVIALSLIGMLLLSAGAMAIWKRLSTSPMRALQVEPSPLRPMQALRLWVPVLWVALACLGAHVGVDVVTPAVDEALGDGPASATRGMAVPGGPPTRMAGQRDAEAPP